MNEEIEHLYDVISADVRRCREDSLALVDQRRLLKRVEKNARTARKILELSVADTAPTDEPMKGETVPFRRPLTNSDL